MVLNLAVNNAKFQVGVLPVNGNDRNGTIVLDNLGFLEVWFSQSCPEPHSCQEPSQDNKTTIRPPSRAGSSCIFDTCATSCAPLQPRHARSGRTNVGSRATSSLSISPCCDTGDRQYGHAGLARCMNGPAHPRHNAECPQRPCRRQSPRDIRAPPCRVRQQRTDASQQAPAVEPGRPAQSCAGPWDPFSQDPCPFCVAHCHCARSSVMDPTSDSSS